MKRFISIMILLSMMTTFIPVYSEGTIENVLAIVKSKISIPEEYTVFESSSQVMADNKEWRFWWRTPGDNPEKAADEISVTADEKGNIKRFYHFKDSYLTNDTNAHFSKYDKSDARIFALRFVTNVCPELFDKIELNRQALTANITKDLKTANVSFYRIENKIPYYDNYMNFVIDLSTGAVIQYECVWDYDLIFPNEEEPITPQAARRAYEEKAGIELRYRLKTEGDKKQAYLVYTVANEEKMIDAITGQVIQGAAVNSGIPYAVNESASQNDLSAVSFTEQEILELHSIEKVMTINQAEEYIRSIPELPITDQYTLRSSNFTKRDSRYLIYLEFAKIPNQSIYSMTDKERAMLAAGDYSYIRVTVDAANMDVVSLYQYNKEAEKLEYLANEDYARNQVNDFLFKYLKNKYINCIYKEMVKLDGGKTYQYHYICLLGNVPFEGNGITVYYDATIGEIKSVVCNWQFNLTVESAKEIISLQQAKDLIFKHAPLQLAYININGNTEKYAGGQKPKLKLVYMLDPFIPKNVLASQGDIVDKSGKKFKITKYQKFVDIEDHYAQVQIQRLSNNLIIDESGYFYPENTIRQEDYMNMLFSGIKGIRYDNAADLYREAVRAKIITADSWNPDAGITREEAVVSFIRMMGLESVAQLKGIYVLDYADSSSISEEKKGYIALAKGYGIVSGHSSAFEPQRLLTRAEAAVMVYNYLNR